ncbi:MAG: DUF169 domain-containing protein [Desulfobacterales bacterium]|nr:DUF169 domain-containing protein [Desulfobacterales bacterium]
MFPLPLWNDTLQDTYGGEYGKKIAEALGVRYYSVALLWIDEKPERALQLKEGKWGCVMWMSSQKPKRQKMGSP